MPGIEWENNCGYMWFNIFCLEANSRDSISSVLVLSPSYFGIVMDINTGEINFVSEGWQLTF